MCIHVCKYERTCVICNMYVYIYMHIWFFIIGSACLTGSAGFCLCFFCGSFKVFEVCWMLINQGVKKNPWNHHLEYTPPKFNMEPEKKIKKSLEKEVPLGNHHFQGVVASSCHRPKLLQQKSPRLLTRHSSILTSKMVHDFLISFGTCFSQTLNAWYCIV